MQRTLMCFCILCACWLPACQKGTSPTGSPTAASTEKDRSAPERVDVRGNIIRHRYNQGQVMIEVEGTPSQYSRYTRAYVLVLPSTQLVGRDGNSISLSELQQGQNVAVLLRSGGQGNLEGIGVARKIWVEEVY